MHAPDLVRLVPFAKRTRRSARGIVIRRGKVVDRWYRTQKDAVRPYRFKEVETSIDDFFDEVGTVLREPD